MNESPLVYIIVLTWNGKDDTIECLNSLQRLSYPNAHILLVDNASTDGTVQTVRSLFPHVDILVNATNLRFAGGNNVGINHALSHNAEYILLLNNDTIVEPDFLTHLVRAAANDETVGMAAPKIYYFDHPRVIWFAGGKIEWWKGWISHTGIREVDRGQYDAIQKVDYLTGCCMLVKRKVIEQIGLLDERYHIYGEDADWCIRAARAGYTLLYVPSAVVWHKLSVSAGGHLSWFKNWNKLKSHLRHWLTIPVWMGMNVIAGYWKVRRGISM
jgi:hypothetical protein